MKRKVKMIMMTSIVAILGITTLAFSGWGPGYGCGGRGMGWGSSDHSPRGYGNCPRYSSGNSAGQQDELFKQTADIRQSLYEKEMALRSELVKRNPDPELASSLQKEISGLESQLDQKMLDFHLKRKSEDPNYNPGGWGCGRQGRGGGGYCWK
jgi:hypothetical protein